MPDIAPCLWFDGNAEEAANFYVSLLPDSRVDTVHRAPSDYPSGRAGGVSALGAPIAVAGSLRRLPTRPKKRGASKGATTSFTAPAY
jgi:uncharacterized glyoxalase superfamily protein PhnB